MSLAAALSTLRASSSSSSSPPPSLTDWPPSILYSTCPLVGISSASDVREFFISLALSALSSLRITLSPSLFHSLSDSFLLQNLFDQSKVIPFDRFTSSPKDILSVDTEVLRVIRILKDEFPSLSSVKILDFLSFSHRIFSSQIVISKIFIIYFHRFDTTKYIQMAQLVSKQKGNDWEQNHNKFITLLPTYDNGHTHSHSNVTILSLSQSLCSTDYLMDTLQSLLDEFRHTVSFPPLFSSDFLNILFLFLFSLLSLCRPADQKKNKNKNIFRLDSLKNFIENFLREIKNPKNSFLVSRTKEISSAMVAEMVRTNMWEYEDFCQFQMDTMGDIPVPNQRENSLLYTASLISCASEFEFSNKTFGEIMENPNENQQEMSTKLNLFIFSLFFSHWEKEQKSIPTEDFILFPLIEFHFSEGIPINQFSLLGRCLIGSFIRIDTEKWDKSLQFVLFSLQNIHSEFQNPNHKKHKISSALLEGNLSFVVKPLLEGIQKYILSASVLSSPSSPFPSLPLDVFHLIEKFGVFFSHHFLSFCTSLYTQLVSLCHENHLDFQQIAKEFEEKNHKIFSPKLSDDSQQENKNKKSKISSAHVGFPSFGSQGKHSLNHRIEVFHAVFRSTSLSLVDTSYSHVGNFSVFEFVQNGSGNPNSIDILLQKKPKETKMEIQNSLQNAKNSSLSALCSSLQRVLSVMSKEETQKLMTMGDVREVLSDLVVGKILENHLTTSISPLSSGPSLALSPFHREELFRHLEFLLDLFSLYFPQMFSLFPSLFAAILSICQTENLKRKVHRVMTTSASSSPSLSYSPLFAYLLSLLSNDARHPHHLSDNSHSFASQIFHEIFVPSSSPLSSSSFLSHQWSEIILSDSTDPNEQIEAFSSFCLIVLEMFSVASPKDIFSLLDLDFVAKMIQNAFRHKQIAKSKGFYSFFKHFCALFLSMKSPSKGISSSLSSISSSSLSHFGLSSADRAYSDLLFLFLEISSSSSADKHFHSKANGNPNPNPFQREFSLLISSLNIHTLGSLLIKNPQDSNFTKSDFSVSLFHLVSDSIHRGLFFSLFSSDPQDLIIFLLISFLSKSIRIRHAALSAWSELGNRNPNDEFIDFIKGKREEILHDSKGIVSVLSAPNAISLLDSSLSDIIVQFISSLADVFHSSDLCPNGVEMFHRLLTLGEITLEHSNNKNKWNKITQNLVENMENTEEISLSKGKSLDLVFYPLVKMISKRGNPEGFNISLSLSLLLGKKTFSYFPSFLFAATIHSVKQFYNFHFNHQCNLQSKDILSSLRSLSILGILCTEHHPSIVSQIGSTILIGIKLVTFGEIVQNIGEFASQSEMKLSTGKGAKGKGKGKAQAMSDDVYDVSVDDSHASPPPLNVFIPSEFLCEIIVNSPLSNLIPMKSQKEFLAFWNNISHSINKFVELISSSSSSSAAAVSSGNISILHSVIKLSTLGFRLIAHHEIQMSFHPSQMEQMDFISMMDTVIEMHSNSISPSLSPSPHSLSFHHLHIPVTFDLLLTFLSHFLVSVDFYNHFVSHLNVGISKIFSILDILHFDLNDKMRLAISNFIKKFFSFGKTQIIQTESSSNSSSIAKTNGLSSFCSKTIFELTQRIHLAKKNDFFPLSANFFALEISKNLMEIPTFREEFSALWIAAVALKVNNEKHMGDDATLGTVLFSVVNENFSSDSLGNQLGILNKISFLFSEIQTKEKQKYFTFLHGENLAVAMGTDIPSLSHRQKALDSILNCISHVVKSHSFRQKIRLAEDSLQAEEITSNARKLIGNTLEWEKQHGDPTFIPLLSTLRSMVFSLLWPSSVCSILQSLLIHFIGDKNILNKILQILIQKLEFLKSESLDQSIYQRVVDKTNEKNKKQKMTKAKGKERSKSHLMSHKEYLQRNLTAFTPIITQLQHIVKTFLKDFPLSSTSHSLSPNHSIDIENAQLSLMAIEIFLSFPAHCDSASPSLINGTLDDFVDSLLLGSSHHVVNIRISSFFTLSSAMKVTDGKNSQLAKHFNSFVTNALDILQQERTQSPPSSSPLSSLFIFSVCTFIISCVKSSLKNFLRPFCGKILREIVWGNPEIQTEQSNAVVSAAATASSSSPSHRLFSVWRELLSDIPKAFSPSFLMSEIFSSQIEIISMGINGIDGIFPPSPYDTIVAFLHMAQQTAKRLKSSSSVGSSQTDGSEGNPNNQNNSIVPLLKSAFTFILRLFDIRYACVTSSSSLSIFPSLPSIENECVEFMLQIFLKLNENQFGSLFTKIVKFILNTKQSQNPQTKSKKSIVKKKSQQGESEDEEEEKSIPPSPSLLYSRLNVFSHLQCHLLHHLKILFVPFFAHSVEILRDNLKTKMEFTEGEKEGEDKDKVRNNTTIQLLYSHSVRSFMLWSKNVQEATKFELEIQMDSLFSHLKIQMENHKNQQKSLKIRKDTGNNKKGKEKGKGKGNTRGEESDSESESESDNHSGDVSVTDAHDVPSEPSLSPPSFSHYLKSTHIPWIKSFLGVVLRLSDGPSGSVGVGSPIWREFHRLSLVLCRDQNPLFRLVGVIHLKEFFELGKAKVMEKLTETLTAIVTLMEDQQDDIVEYTQILIRTIEQITGEAIERYIT